MASSSSEQVPDVVRALARSLAPILGHRLLGVYLGGSLSMGDFVWASSDYDVLVVVDGRLTTEDLTAIDRLHGRLRAEFPDAERLEGDYAPSQLLVPAGTTEPVPGFQRGRLDVSPCEIVLSADNLANMRQHGIPVYGPPAADLLPSVTPNDVRAAVLAMLREGPVPCASEVEAASAVLSLVRSLSALESGRPTTRSEGARWALAHLDARWHDVVRRALAVRSGEEPAETDRTLRHAFPDFDRAVRPVFEGLDGSGRPS
jgi:hypothetical protein